MKQKKEIPFNPYGVKVGDIWKSNDPRETRKVKVIGFFVNDKGIFFADVQGIGTERKAKRRIDRFNGRHNSYYLVERSHD
jgi:hypothetical protein